MLLMETKTRNWSVENSLYKQQNNSLLDCPFHFLNFRTAEKLKKDQSAC